MQQTETETHSATQKEIELCLKSTAQNSQRQKAHQVQEAP